jgi:hypothetical protein
MLGIYLSDSRCHCPIARCLVAISGLPHALLLLNFCLALIDRYIAINFPLMHRDKMTSRFAKVSIFVCNIFLTFHLKFTYIMGLVPLGCEIWIVHNIVLGLTMLIWNWAIIWYFLLKEIMRGNHNNFECGITLAVTITQIPHVMMMVRVLSVSSSSKFVWMCSVYG